MYEDCPEIAELAGKTVPARNTPLTNGTSAYFDLFIVNIKGYLSVFRLLQLIIRYWLGLLLNAICFSEPTLGSGAKICVQSTFVKTLLSKQSLQLNASTLLEHDGVL